MQQIPEVVVQPAQEHHGDEFAHHRHEALEGREREWWAKATAHVLRLAITLCLFDWAKGAHEGQQTPEPTTVAETYMESAIRLVRDYFWPHAPGRPFAKSD